MVLVEGSAGETLRIASNMSARRGAARLLHLYSEWSFQPVQLCQTLTMKEQSALIGGK